MKSTKPERSEIPGLAKYLPAAPIKRKHQPGYCDYCGKKIESYDPELVKQGYWQPSFCDACLNEGDDDDDD